MNVCDEGGWVVAGDEYFPEDPSDFYTDRGKPVACSNLVCRICGQKVRNSVSGKTRHYECKCRSWDETERHRMEDHDSWPGDPSLPWRCAGHPIATLPRTIDGVAIGVDNLRDTVKRALSGWIPDGARKADRPEASWAGRLYARLRGSPHQAAVAAAAADCLEAPVPKSRALALNFVWRTADLVGRRRALDLLQGNREGFVGVSDEVTSLPWDKTLEDSLWRVVGELVQGVESVRTVARAEVTAPGRGRMVLFQVLAREDPDWFLEHVVDIAKATPQKRDELLEAIEGNLPGPTRERAAKQALANTFPE